MYPVVCVDALRVHAQRCKIIKTCGHFPTDDAATTLIWLALQTITRRWTLPPTCIIVNELHTQKT